jgi:hypothetical protein
MSNNDDIKHQKKVQDNVDRRAAAKRKRKKVRITSFHGTEKEYNDMIKRQKKMRHEDMSASQKRRNYRLTHNDPDIEKPPNETYDDVKTNRLFNQRHIQQKYDIDNELIEDDLKVPNNHVVIAPKTDSNNVSNTLTTGAETKSEIISKRETVNFILALLPNDMQHWSKKHDISNILDYLPIEHIRDAFKEMGITNIPSYII